MYELHFIVYAVHDIYSFFLGMNAFYKFAK